MAQGRKKLLSLTYDSALSMMQEIYNDIVEQKNTASLITKKMLTFMKDAEDMSTIGPVIKDQQKILNLCTDRKIALVKLQSILLKQSGNGNGSEPFGKLQLTEEDKKLLEQFVNEDESNNGGKYEI